MVKKTRLNRRAFLGGVGGAMIALPLLDVMRSNKASAGSADPCRYVVAFAGVSLVSGSAPSQSGAGYAMSPAFAALEPLRDQLMLVSGLDIPAAGAKNDANAIPLGGRPAGPFHNNTVEPLLSGYRGGMGPILREPTSDQIVADAIGSDTPIHSLQLRAQAEAYVGGFGSMSSRQQGNNVAPLPPIANPLVAYETLFSNFAPTTPGTVVGQTLAQRRSVLDLVERRAGRLIQRVSYADRIRLERHYDEIRALEQRLAEIVPPMTGGGCEAPQTPTVPGGGSAYSGEDERGRLMSDLLHMAFVCDLTRVASFMLTFAQCQMSAQTITGYNYACHELTHAVAQQELGNGAGKVAWGEMNAWHVEQFAYLAQKLANTAEDDGTLLDRTAMVLLFEAGTTSSHSTTNMVAAVLGRGDSLRLGEHVSTQGAHPSHVLQTLMGISGANTPFGEVPGSVPQMLA